MDTLGLQSYHVVGWSLGGHIGIEMWSTMDSVRSLTITGTPPSAPQRGGGRRKLQALGSDAARRQAGLSDEDAFAYGKAMLDGHFDPHTALGRCVKSADGRARRMMMENGLAGIGVDQVHAVATCPKPLAILQGKNDPFVDVTHMSRLTYRNLWRKNLVLLEAGHAPHWTHPNLFNEFLGDFLSEVN